MGPSGLRMLLQMHMRSDQEPRCTTCSNTIVPSQSHKHCCSWLVLFLCFFGRQVTQLIFPSLTQGLRGCFWIQDKSNYGYGRTERADRPERKRNVLDIMSSSSKSSKLILKDHYLAQGSPNTVLGAENCHVLPSPCQGVRCDCSLANHWQ